ncbi:hypothetical protein GcM3_052004 [Golovinomyces cichoracearum]|uniref:RxLR effector protein n=1 Tax=Golovinomyces cichoracearum TaxID=62708 RepID=A0A420IYW5_9PEZI|nr:hypothetical protein GcM3_052004 [Golovinomyces cichoracearum]
MHLIRVIFIALLCGAMAMPTRNVVSDPAKTTENPSQETTKEIFNSNTEFIGKIREHSISSSPLTNQTDTTTSETTTTIVSEFKQGAKIPNRASLSTNNLTRVLVLDSHNKKLAKRSFFGTSSVKRLLRCFRFTDKRSDHEDYIANQKQGIWQLGKEHRKGWISRIFR